MRQGDPGNSAYLIQSGSVRVFSQNGDVRVELARLGVGQLFGEMALVVDELRTASVEALEDCNLIVITRTAFKEKLSKSDPTIRGALKMLSERIVASNSSLTKKDASPHELTVAVHAIYQNVLSDLKGSKKEQFEEEVGGHLKALLDAIENFD